MRLQDILVELREERGLTQLQLSNLLHVSNSSISAYETGARLPSIETLVDLANFYGVTPDYLLGFEKTAYFPSTLSEEFVHGTSMFSMLMKLSKLTLEQKIVINLIVKYMEANND